MKQKWNAFGAICTRKMAMVHPKKTLWYIAVFSMTTRRKWIIFGVPRSWRCAPSSDAFFTMKKGWEYQEPKLVQSGVSWKKRDIPLFTGLGDRSSQSNSTALFLNNLNSLLQKRMKKESLKKELFFIRYRLRTILHIPVHTGAKIRTTFAPPVQAIISNPREWITQRVCWLFCT